MSGLGDAGDLVFGEFAVRAIDERAEFTSIDEERLTWERRRIPGIAP